MAKDKTKSEEDLTGDERREALGELNNQNGLADPHLPSERERLGTVREGTPRRSI